MKFNEHNSFCKMFKPTMKIITRNLIIFFCLYSHPQLEMKYTIQSKTVNPVFVLNVLRPNICIYISY